MFPAVLPGLCSEQWREKAPGSLFKMGLSQAWQYGLWKRQQGLVWLLGGEFVNLPDFWRIDQWADSLYLILFTNTCLLMLMLFVDQPFGSLCWCFYAIHSLSSVWFWETWQVHEAGSKNMPSSNVTSLFFLFCRFFSKWWFKSCWCSSYTEGESGLCVRWAHLSLIPPAHHEHCLPHPGSYDAAESQGTSFMLELGST